VLKAVSVALAPRAAEQVTWIMGVLVVLCHPTLDGYCGLGVPNSRLELSFAGDNSASSAGASSSSGSVTGLLSFMQWVVQKRRAWTWLLSQRVVT